jgi:hypothetical protein
MENTAKLGLFAVHKIVSEYAKRIYGHMEKRHKTGELSGNNGQTWNIFRSLLFIQDGLDEAKKPFHPTVPLMGQLKFWPFINRLINVSLFLCPRNKMLLSVIFLLYFIPCGLPCTQYRRRASFVIFNKETWQKVMEISDYIYIQFFTEVLWIYSILGGIK